MIPSSNNLLFIGETLKIHSIDGTRLTITPFFKKKKKMYVRNHPVYLTLFFQYPILVHKAEPTSDAETPMKDALQVLGFFLCHKRYLVGDQVTLADIAVAGTLSFSDVIKAPFSFATADLSGKFDKASHQPYTALRGARNCGAVSMYA